MCVVVEATINVGMQRACCHPHRLVLCNVHAVTIEYLLDARATALLGAVFFSDAHIILLH
jgi:hypothetical protein